MLSKPSTKAESTLAARLALAGWVMQCTGQADGRTSYTATRWGRATVAMASLSAVAEFADRAGQS